MDQMNKKNEKELNPEELKAVNGGNLLKVLIRVPNKPWVKRKTPTEAPGNDEETGNQ